MKLGLVSAILEAYDYEQMIDILAEMGFSCVEAACWPAGKVLRLLGGVAGHRDVFVDKGLGVFRLHMA